MLCRILTIVACVWTVVGCVSHHSERVADVNPVGWSVGDTARVKIVNSDTLSTRNISILVRTNNKFSIEELPLKVIVTNPNGEALESVVFVNLSGPARVSDTYNQTIAPFVYSATLPQRGVYKFDFVSMVDKVKGVTSVGIKIDITKNNGQK